jgi:hypothetical protein
MFCTECGNAISLKTKFCGACGANVSAEAAMHAGSSAAVLQKPSEVPQPELVGSSTATLTGSAPAAAQPVSSAPPRRLKSAAVMGAALAICIAAGYWSWSYFATPSAGIQRSADAKAASVQADRASVEQAEIAAAQAALDREIALEESAAKQQAQGDVTR